MTFVLNVLISAAIISLAAWLSGRLPGTAGFIVALPLTSMIVIPLSYIQHGNPQTTITFAKSIFVAVPVSLLFFIPFLLSGRLGLSFWQAYGLGCLILPVGFFIHRAVVRVLA